MEYCKKCVMPNTRPGVVLDSEGVCQGCRHAEERKSTDWNKRFEELKKLCDQYRRSDGYYDCIVAVSSGKDSHFQVHVMKNLMHMNPLLVSVGDPFTKTKTGTANMQNIARSFNCDVISLQLSPDLIRRMIRISFEEFGHTTWPIDQAIYAFPLKMAVIMKIPLIVYGENISYEYGGSQNQETYSAKDQIHNDVVKKKDWDWWYERGIKKEEINSMLYPTADELEQAKIEPIYLSYFIAWNGYNNYQIAKQHGFHDLTHEWQREGFIEQYDQIDSIGYLLTPWLKYPKFGHARATDVSCYWIRTGKINRQDAIKLVKEHDHKLDQKVLDDFLQFTGYSPEEFYTILEKFWNRDIFEKVNGTWKMKKEIADKLK